MSTSRRAELRATRASAASTALRDVGVDALAEVLARQADAQALERLAVPRASSRV